jgi:hypothetical protein
MFKFPMLVSKVHVFGEHEQAVIAYVTDKAHIS